MGEYLRLYSAWEPNLATGEVYAINFHGTYGYATYNEYVAYHYMIPALFLLLFICAAIVDRRLKDANSDWKNPSEEA